MIVWLDAQFPPALATWLRDTFGVDAKALRDLGLRDAEDRAIFALAREAGAVLISKDSDFVDLVQDQGAPPQLIWVTCGNVSNARMKTILTRAWPILAEKLISGERIVELSD